VRILEFKGLVQRILLFDFWLPQEQFSNFYRPQSLPQRRFNLWLGPNANIIHEHFLKSEKIT
jgi:hypothetical protein